MSASLGQSSGKSESRSPFEGGQKDLASSLLAMFNSGKSPYGAFEGVPSTISNPAGSDDLYNALMGNAPDTSPVAGAGQTTRQLLETGLPADTTGTENALDAVRQRTLAEESANLKERSGVAGTRFSTGYLSQEGELSRKSLEDYLNTIAPLRYGAAEAANARRSATLSALFNLATQRSALGQEQVQTSLTDQRLRELGYLPYALQFLSAGIPHAKSKQESLHAGGGIGGTP